MADDKKNIGPEAEKPGDAPQEKKAEPVKDTPPATEQPAPGVPQAPVVEAVPKAQPTPTVENQPEEKATPAPKVLDFSAAKNKAPAKEETAPEKKSVKEQAAEKPKRGRPAKADKAAPAEKPKQPRDKMPQSKKAPGKEAPIPPKREVPSKEAKAPEQEQPAAPRDATRSAEPEQIVYINLSELHPFKNHPFGVRDDAEMQGLVDSVKAAGVNQPALVRPREDGGYEIIAGHRRQRASELAGFANMPCIVRNMTDDEAILAMTDDNLRHRERILPTEKAQSLKMQVEAIKHQGSRPGEEDKDAGKRSTQVVGDRNGMNYKQVQRYIRLTELVPDLQKMVDEKKLAFTPAVEISFIRPKNQRYIAVSIEGQQSLPSLSQAQKMRELDKEGKLNGDVIDGILSQEKKEVDKVIINSAELEKYFGKDKSPREMKDKIISLLDDWKAKQPPELGKPEKKTDLEK
mgnify:FL=1